ncbi:uncharacterized protein MKK02DRAFT_44374 [Dioszegia hungarica]|uniref:Uncharacterized protein n=1 Tax=Dioszegia hungarica TaxID=4972 RepID=A0AA38H954_9TREE|nr:uncharacterized protein MKK02DRAFT_44374 [Dioszegia hungarica]KAI9635676.1 hypothetical protein MKK02DRAFT_44374 [Dioszegia hungarica]
MPALDSQLYTYSDIRRAVDGEKRPDWMLKADDATAAVYSDPDKEDLSWIAISRGKDGLYVGEGDLNHFTWKPLPRDLHRPHALLSTDHTGSFWKRMGLALTKAECLEVTLKMMEELYRREKGTTVMNDPLFDEEDGALLVRRTNSAHQVCSDVLKAYTALGMSETLSGEAWAELVSYLHPLGEESAADADQQAYTATWSPIERPDLVLLTKYLSASAEESDSVLLPTHALVLNLTNAVIAALTVTDGQDYKSGSSTRVPANLTLDCTPLVETTKGSGAFSWLTDEIAAGHTVESTAAHVNRLYDNEIASHAHLDEMTAPETVTILHKVWE